VFTNLEEVEKLTVFGATGGTGMHVVRQALEAGHQVTAVVRDSARLDVSADDRLDVVRADARTLRHRARGSG
jgi:uncharacterized protein YbjT (DUF2867 family)